MSWPPGLAFRDRIATDGTRWYFRCQSGGHQARASRRTRALIEDARHDHDEEFHRPTGVDEPSPPLGEILTRYARELERRGSKREISPKTVRYYRDMIAALSRTLALDPARQASSFTLLDIQAALEEWRETSSSEGALLRKRVGTLRTILLWAGVAPAWPVPEIAQKRRAPCIYTEEQLDRFEAELPLGSVERAVFIAKRETVMRDVELAELRVGDVDRGRRLIRYTLHAKRARYPHAFPLSPRLARELAPLIEGRAPDEPLFTIEGGPHSNGPRALQETSLRRRYAAASRRYTRRLSQQVREGKLSKGRLRELLEGFPIETISQIRHHGLTRLAQEVDPFTAQLAVGHRSITTTERYYRNRVDATPATRRAAKVLTKRKARRKG